MSVSGLQWVVELVCHAERTGNQFPDQGAKIVSLGAGGPPAQGPCHQLRDQVLAGSLSWFYQLSEPVSHQVCAPVQVSTEEYCLVVGLE